MALPILLQKLFANNGVGPKLRADIMPDSVLRNTAQTGFSSTEKAQARTNIGAADASDVVKLSKQTGLTATQKTQARTNIGAADASDVVKLSKQTGLTATQKTQVYTNLGLIQMFKELCLENGATQGEIDALQ